MDRVACGLYVDLVSPDEIKTILGDGCWEELLGLAEAESLDFKAQPYALDVDDSAKRHRNRWELAKDVVAMANSPQGGCIVMGVRTEQSPTSNEDVTVELSPFPCSLLDPEQHRDTIATNAYPLIQGVDVSIHKRDDDDRCLALIEVPPQDEDDGPFLLNKILDPEGKRTEGFALPKREGSHTRWQPIGMIHRDIADGRRSRRAGILGIDASSPAEVAQVSRESLEADMTAIEDYMDWQDAAIYALAAAPVSVQGRIENFSDAGLRQQFENPRGVRGDLGFGIGYRQEPMLEQGALIAVDGDFRYRRLARDGRLLVAVKAEEELLGRSYQLPTGEPRPLVINEIALVEFTYEFCRFQTEVLQPQIASQWHLAVIVRGARTRPWSLRLGRPAQEAQWDDFIEIIEGGEDSAEDAYRLLSHVCDLFGRSATDLRFVSSGRVDVEAIKSA